MLPRGKAGSYQPLHLLGDCVLICVGLVVLPGLTDQPQLLLVGCPRWGSHTKGLVTS